MSNPLQQSLSDQVANLMANEEAKDMLKSYYQIGGMDKELLKLVPLANPNNLNISTEGRIYTALAGTINDKLPPIELIATGLIIITSPKTYAPLVPLKLKGAYHSLVQALYDIKSRGETDVLVAVDAASSGTQIMACGYGCKESFHNAVGSETDVDKVFLLPPTDIYTALGKDAESLVATIYDEYTPGCITDMSRGALKGGKLPNMYGSENGFAHAIEAFYGDSDKSQGELELLGTCLLEADIALSPAIYLHVQTMYEPDYTGIDFIEFNDLLGRKVKFSRTIDIGYDLHLPDGGDIAILSTAPIPDDHKAAPKCIAMVANTVHNADAILMAIVHMILKKAGMQMLDRHDAMILHPQHVSFAIMAYQHALIWLTKQDFIKNVMTQVFPNTPFKTPYVGSKEEMVQVVYNSHALMG